jgi:phosphonate transport system substrate-binding protein
MRLWNFPILSLVIGWCLLGAVTADGETLKIGSINYSPESEMRAFAPLQAYLIKHLQTEGIDQGKVVVADSIAAMATLLQSRQVDLYIDSFYPTLAVARLSGSKLLLRRWKARKGEYRSILFTHKDNKISRLEDLRGKIIGFESPFSSTGYFLPKINLLDRGLRLTAKRHASDAVKPDEIGYVFTRYDSKTILQVLNRALAAGATDDEKFNVTARNVDTLKILYESGSFPRHMVSHRADLPTKLVTRIKETLLQMSSSDEGFQALKAFENTTRFDEIPQRDLDSAAALMKHIDVELKLPELR